MAIVKRRGRYQVKVRSPEGAWWTATCDTRQAAERLEREMREAKDLGRPWKHPRDRAVRLTVREVCEAYMRAHLRRLKPSTIRNRAYQLEAFLIWGDQVSRRGFIVTQLSRALLERWADEQLAAGVSPATVANNLRAPMAVWGWAYDYDEDLGWEGLIPRYRRPAMPAQRRSPTIAPSWAEIDSMLCQLGPAWARRAALIQRYTGMRIGETLRLRWEDVREAELRIRAGITKGEYGARHVPLHPDLRRRMEEWQREGALLCGPRGEAIAARQGYAARTYRRAWAKACARREVYTSPTHAIRRTVKSELLGAGASLAAVDAILGHGMRRIDQAYIDLAALDLPAVIALIPAAAVEVPA